MEGLPVDLCFAQKYSNRCFFFDIDCRGALGVDNRLPKLIIATVGVKVKSLFFVTVFLIFTKPTFMGGSKSPIKAQGPSHSLLPSYVWQGVWTYGLMA
jgi:hypothetical protein